MTISILHHTYAAAMDRIIDLDWLLELDDNYMPRKRRRSKAERAYGKLLGRIADMAYSRLCESSYRTEE